MKVLFFLRYSRDQASSRMRGFYVAEELEKRGINCHVIYGSSRKVYLNFLSKLTKYDFVYFQKRYSWIDIKLNKFARLMGKKTIFDIDDAPSGTTLNSEVEERAIEMMRNSSAVVVGSHKLRDFAQNFNDQSYVVHTPINLNYYKPSNKPSRAKDSNYITLGWIGNGINYKNDLLMLIKPIEKIGEKYDIKLTIVGALGQKEIYQGFSKLENVEVEIIDSIGWANPIEIPSVISSFDIGLYPLLDNKYNQYKCGGKALEYMATEVPPIASPVGENKFIIEHGSDGFLASNEKEWEQYLTYLVENEALRKRMGKVGRKKVEENYSLEICASKILKILGKLKKER